MVGMPGLMKSQLFTRLALPTKDYTGQTVIVTGSNNGIGLEVVRYLVRLNAHVIMAVRSVKKGETAKSIIDATEKKPHAIEVWELNYSDYASIEAFADRAAGLDRLDVAILNAGVLTQKFELIQGNETNIQINVISTVYLALLLLPTLRKTSVKHAKDTVLNITGSFVHWLTEFPERKAPNILEGLNNEKRSRMVDRYYVSKLIEFQMTRELASRITASNKQGSVIVSSTNPGLVVTNIFDKTEGASKVQMIVLKKLLGRTPEMGARPLMLAAAGGKETHGQYIDDNGVGEASAFITGKEGDIIQKKIWGELMKKLNKIKPGVENLV